MKKETKSNRNYFLQIDDMFSNAKIVRKSNIPVNYIPNHSKKRFQNVPNHSETLQNVPNCSKSFQNIQKRSKTSKRFPNAEECEKIVSNCSKHMACGLAWPHV